MEIIVNKDGEIIKGKIIDARFFKAYDEGFIEVALNKELDGTSVKLLLYCLGKMKYNNTVGINQTKVGKEFKMNRSCVSRAIKVLCKNKYIELIEKGNPNIYRVYHGLAYKGNGSVARKY